MCAIIHVINTNNVYKYNRIKYCLSRDENIREILFARECVFVVYTVYAFRSYYGSRLAENIEKNINFFLLLLLYYRIIRLMRRIQFPAMKTRKSNRF